MRLRNDYSFAENSLGFWATVTLSVLAVASIGLQFTTAPISCRVPPEFTKEWTDFVHHLCFHKEYIYSVDIFQDEALPYGNSRSKTQYTYHQWVPFALGFAALLCLIPHVVWCAFSGLLCLDLHTLMQTLSDNQRQNAAGRHVILRDSALLVQAVLRGGNWILTATTAARKVLVLLVCVTQLFLAALVFKPQLNLLESNQTEPDPNASLPLPERFFCDVRFRLLHRVDTFTIDCSMKLAQMYSKGFTFLFYFFLFLTLSSFFDTLVWICRVLIPGLRDRPLKRHLAVGTSDSQHQAVMPRFLLNLGGDGYLLLAVTADYCGALAAADLTNHLWYLFLEGPRFASASAPMSSGSGPTSLGPASSSRYVFPSAPGPSGVKKEGAAGNDQDAIPLMPIPGQ